MGRVWILCCVLALSGCLSADLRVIRPVDPPVHEVELSVTPAPGVAITDNQLADLSALVRMELAKNGVSVVSSSPAAAPLVEGTIEEYHRGVRELRRWLGWLGLGIGKGTFASSWVVKDISGRPVGECRIRGRITNGVNLGGDYEEVFEVAADRLAQCLKGARS